MANATDGKTVMLVQRATTLQGLLDKHGEQIARALPKHMGLERFKRVAFTTALKNERLLMADQKSFVSALIQSAQLGLEVDDVRGHAYLVPFWNNKMKRMDVQFIPGYKGLLELAYRSDALLSIDVNVVWDKEPHIYKAGDNAKIDHDPQPPSKRGENKIAVYAIAHLKGGGITRQWLWKEDVEKIRNMSKSYQAYKEGKLSECIWVDHEEIMWVKTAIRHIAKFIPQSSELQRAVTIEEKAEAGEPIKEFFFEDTEGAVTETVEEGKAEGVTVKEETKAEVESLAEKLKRKNEEKAEGKPKKEQLPLD